MSNTNPPCWPEDPHFEAPTEIRVPPTATLKAFWKADLLDVNGVPPGTILAVTDPFEVRFRVELTGDLWRCLSGCWCFDLGFTPLGEGTSFNLSHKLDPDALQIHDWHGCKTQCVEVRRTVPAGTVPAEFCGTLYKVGARCSLHCCCGDEEHTHGRPILVGFEDLEEREFY